MRICRMIQSDQAKTSFLCVPRRSTSVILAALLVFFLLTACQSSAPSPPSFFTNTPVPFVTTPAPQRSPLFIYRSQLRLAELIWLPDTRHLAFVSGGSASGGESVYIFDRLTRTLTRTLTLPVLPSGTAGEVAWSPDGSSIVFASADGNLTVWNTLSGRQSLAYDSHISGFPLWAWAPDNQRIAIASQVNAPQVAQIWNVITRHELLSFSIPTPNITDLEWSPDGTHLATLAGDHTFQLWDSTTGQAIQHFTDPTLAIILWSPDGRRILSSLTAKRTTNISLSIWDVLTGRKLLTYSGHTHPAVAAQWSADGTRILSISPAELLLWNTSTGQTILRLPLQPGSNPAEARLSPDGRYLAFAPQGNQVQIWNAITGHELLINASHRASVQSLVWSPASKTIASADADGFVEVWDATTGRGLDTYHVDAGGIQDLAWSPDGQLLAVTTQDDVLELLRA
jgi:WD40 repeat protein